MNIETANIPMNIQELKENGFIDCIKAWGDTNHWRSLRKMRYLYDYDTDLVSDLKVAIKAFDLIQNKHMFISNVYIESHPQLMDSGETQECYECEIDKDGHEIGGHIVNLPIMIPTFEVEYGDGILELKPYGISPNSTEGEYISFGSGESVLFNSHFCDILYGLLYLYTSETDLYRLGNLEVLRNSKLIQDTDQFESQLDLIAKKEQITVKPNSQNDVRFKQIENLIIGELEWAKVSIFLAVAWITNDRIVKILKEKHEQGLDVCVIVNRDAINEKNLPDFGDIPVYSKRGDRGGIMHHKFCVIDNQLALSGSYNWTNNAEFRNDEDISTERDGSLVSEYTLEFKKLKSDAIPFISKKKTGSI